MSDKKTGNGQDDSINEESQNYGLSNSNDTIFNDDFSDIEDSVSSEDFEQPVEEDFSGLNDVETGDVVEDYFNDEFDDPEESSLGTGKDDEEITSVDDHEFENDEFGDDFSDISEFDSTPESTAILHEDEDTKPHYEENSDNWDEDEFSDPINNEDVAITSNGGNVFDDEETPYYNDDYSDEDIEIGDLDDYDEDSGLPWWAWLIIAGVLSGLIAGGAYLYNKDNNGEDSGDSAETTSSPVQNGGEGDGANVSNSELNALRKELEEKQVELDKVNEEKTQLQNAVDDTKNNDRTVTETKEIPGQKTVVTKTQRLPAETFTNTETRTLTNTITNTNTITRKAPAQAPQKITVTSTVQAPRMSSTNNNASPRTVTRTTTVTRNNQGRNNQGRNITVTRTKNNVVTRTNTVYRTTTVTYERYIKQRYS